ncbi:hypothetical protein [Caloramator sp. Dgby_cultured_2]|uniref:hypothetical protein n=1 Tax=Caloramator sp. Dgby_cultured_2 TaxID=3029174 RepID=UPI00237EBFE5|nr:hypothetical protein [Caloramator sp. Dgby_cultured_2]WDU82186.1 hypothetical protein PWK10_10700 [Caloramator sp. Dgby_cultured_2]
MCKIKGRLFPSNAALDVKTAGGMSGEFIITICMACEDPACMEACKFGALTKRNGEELSFIRINARNVVPVQGLVL